MRSDNNFRGLALAALAAWALYAAAPAAAAAGNEDEAAIRENVRQMEAGWNAKSGAQKRLDLPPERVVPGAGRFQKGRALPRGEVERGEQQTIDLLPAFVVHLAP